MPDPARLVREERGGVDAGGGEGGDRGPGQRRRGGGALQGLTLLRFSAQRMTKCLKLCIFGAFQQNLNRLILSQKTPYQLYGVLWRYVTP